MQRRMNVHDKTREVTEVQETGWRVKTPALLNSWQNHVTGDWPEAVVQTVASPPMSTFTTTFLASLLAQRVAQSSRLSFLSSGHSFLYQLSLRPLFPAPRLSAKPRIESASVSSTPPKTRCNRLVYSVEAFEDVNCTNWTVWSCSDAPLSALKA
jgi:hypothetical protein